MSFIADGHVHIYGSFELEKLLSDAHARLIKFGSAQSYLLFTVEPSGQFEFDKIQDQLSDHVITTDDPTIIKLKTPHGDNLFLIAGRQIVSKERLEFLALFCKEDIPDGLSITELSQRLKEVNAIFVLNWAPGKWMFSRFEVVKKLLNEFSPKQLLLCDTALRFIGWPEPSLMHKARSKGFKIIAGSDPFPIKGEEQRVGKYGFICKQDLDFRNALLEGKLEIVGERLMPYQSIWKILSLMLRKKLGV